MVINTPERPSVDPKLGSIVGRFAPSPTGELHLGSLTTAIASYCHIKSLGGTWLLRIEDTDHQRCHATYSKQILLDLERLGLHWDGDVCYQSQREALYNDLLHTQLLDRVYACHCSRKQLQGHDIYPRYCLTSNSLNNNRLTRENKLRSKLTDTASYLPHKHNIEQLSANKVRIQMPNHIMGFIDGIQGVQWANPQTTLGDVVLRRADGTINYFLAASIDDGLQGVTHVMRGLDILPLTTAQIAIMSYLNLPAVGHWYHLPLVENNQGQKLSKQNLATPIDTSSLAKCQQLIQHSLRLLKQPDVEIGSPETMLAQAVKQWSNTPLKYQSVLGQV